MGFMKFLFIGGTRFVGLAMAQDALARGHEVDVFHRGQAGAEALPGARHLLGDRNLNLSALAQGRWDVTVDVCAYRPGEVDRLADALGGRGGHAVFISTASVYDDGVAAMANESAARKPTHALTGLDLDTVPITGEVYGPLKVLCEDRFFARHPQGLVVRPTYVIGPNDHTQRFPHWVRRIAQGGMVDAPGPGDAPMQYIDARDLAQFVVQGAADGLNGCFNAMGVQPPFSFQAFLEATVAAVGPVGTQLNWLDAATAEAAQAGGQSFPLWSQGERPNMLALDASAAMARGLKARPLAQTVQDTWAWARG
jgi:2'-hydroxyisoflavone reductase